MNKKRSGDGIKAQGMKRNKKSKHKKTVPGFEVKKISANIGNTSQGTSFFKLPNVDWIFRREKRSVILYMTITDDDR